MTHFSQPLTPDEFDTLSEISDSVLAVQENVMLNQHPFSVWPHKRLRGERGEMMAELQKVWIEACEDFIKATDVVYNSLAKEHDDELRRRDQVKRLRKLARLGL